MPRGGLREVFRRPEDANSAPRIEDEQVGVAADDHCCTGGEGEFEVLVILGVAAVRDGLCRRKDDAEGVELAYQLGASGSTKRARRGRSSTSSTSARTASETATWSVRSPCRTALAGTLSRRKVAG